MHPTYYRGCWHVVSRCLFERYTHPEGLAPSQKRFTTRRPSSRTRRRCIRLAPIVQYSPLLPPVGVWAVPVSRSYSGVWGRSVTHYSPVRHSHPGASSWDPVRLACVKHAASVHPEPESNPPQKNLFMKRHRHDDSRNKKIDDRLIRKGASHKNLAAV